MNLKDNAKKAFEFNKALAKVFVTSDGEVFVLQTDAVNHARIKKLEDVTVPLFTREETIGESTETPLRIKLSQEAFIAVINANKSVTEIDDLIEGEERPEVLAVAKDRIKELYLAGGQQ